ncbi:CoA-binding protein [Synechococcus sp. PCC 7336]|uniref:CoA-binding protein n=1 Tax=Synechococcus sp. PCC 7336 TaxID=195250 RepID=UPI00034B0033|nr:CoA-binding protein [Synechococcus sp. PCC 7336]
MFANPDDETLRQLLEEAQTIAVVGHSNKPHRDSYRVAQYLRSAGYIVYPVNPAVDEIDGQRCYRTLAEVPEAVDIVNVFRRSEFLAEIVREAIAIQAKGIWAQLGVVDEGAARVAVAGGAIVVMDACIKVEHHRLGIAVKRRF